ncbi:hypothetical protein DI272_11695 [Streptomyces sp. Act143]|uniref:hypothetical protein n=1 Tax=Streptomyces sp. Act143 TaxID=2200760 RepID=UPI000D678673|nr:hypothetical protein [Streptomyces sp. Act143]PWI14747.1 hypothetical protein DI272_11695 [Streptomyces sp. Act143]
MNRLPRLLCSLYVATSAGLAWTTVLQYRHGPTWAVYLAAAASLVPVIAVVREAEWHEERTAAAAVGPGVAGTVDDDVVQAELDAACCERWWTSCGTDHDTRCPHRVPRSSAA